MCLSSFASWEIHNSVSDSFYSVTLFEPSPLLHQTHGSSMDGCVPLANPCTPQNSSCLIWMRDDNSYTSKTVIGLGEVVYEKVKGHLLAGNILNVTFVLEASLLL